MFPGIEWQRYRKASHMINPKPRVGEIDSDSLVEETVSHMAKNIDTERGEVEPVMQYQGNL